MKAMICSDFITMKNSAGQLLGMNLLIALFISICTDSLFAGTAALGIMIPFLFILSISAYDDMNGWQQYRLTLPITRRQVVLGRYAATLILFVACDMLALIFALVVMGVCALLPAGSVPAGLLFENNPIEGLVCSVALTMLIGVVVAAVALPLIMRFGMTKATRFVPVVLVILLAAGIYFAAESGFVEWITPLLGLNASGGMETAFQLVVAVLLVCAFALYAVSAAIANKLYATRQF